MEEVHRWFHVQQYFEEALLVFNSICGGASGTDWRGNLSVHNTNMHTSLFSISWGTLRIFNKFK